MSNPLIYYESNRNIQIPDKINKELKIGKMIQETENCVILSAKSCYYKDDLAIKCIPFEKHNDYQEKVTILTENKIFQLSTRKSKIF